MSTAFDPYHKWLGIPPEDQPPTHYRILGLRRFENDPDVIDSAADQRLAHLKTLQTGSNGLLTQKLMNEISTARVALLNPVTKTAYDKKLKDEGERQGQWSEKQAPSPPPVRYPVPPAPKILPTSNVRVRQQLPEPAFDEFQDTHAHIEQRLATVASKFERCRQMASPFQQDADVTCQMKALETRLLAVRQFYAESGGTKLVEDAVAMLDRDLNDASRWLRKRNVPVLAEVVQQTQQIVVVQSPGSAAQPAPGLTVCFNCRRHVQPYRVTQISSAAWVLFVVLLFVFFPLCWLPLVVMHEDHVVCPFCRAKLF